MENKKVIKKDETTFIFLFIFSIFAVASILICCLYGAFYYPKNVFSSNYPTSSAVVYSAEYLGTVDRKIPTEIKNEGLSRYPTYGQNLSGITNDEKTNIINENKLLCGKETINGSGTFDSMDSEGNLYLKDGTSLNRKLYKHSASTGLYGGNVSDNELGVVKRITMRSNNAGYNITGLYAPAGEVIKIQMNEKDLNATGGLRIFIGQALYNGKANNIWSARNDFCRMPVILNTMDVLPNTKTTTLENGIYTAYVGSFLGGPIYIQPFSSSQVFSVTISGAVNYSHFILGYTTKNEFEKNKNSSAPYFDLLVWDRGVLHSGPKSQSTEFSYDDLYNVAVYWDKVANVSTSMNNSNGIVFIYDPFVAAGAAVAFPGQGSVNCPVNWMRSSLDYNTLINSGAWGNMHEYNHNFQSGWGCGYTGEVTNNALTLVEYSLFTKISANRKLGAGGDGLSGWNSYTSAPWALNLVLSGNIASTNGLAVYSTLNHNFGQDAFIKAKAGGGVSGYLGKWGEVTHQNFSYFAKLIKNYTGENELSEAVSSAQQNYPMFVPISTIYQTGRSYKFDGEKRYIETMQPYKITYGKNFEVDLTKYTINSENSIYQSGSIVLPEDFSYKIKNVSNPQYGKLTKKSDGIYTYSPDKNHLKSGKIYVTIEIKHNTENWIIDDVDLVLELEQTHELNKNILERTIYTYGDNNYQTATEAYNNNYAGYISKTEEDNTNPTQNSNTDIWVPNPNNNAVMEVKGKLLVPTDGKYRLALRGRNHAALYYSLDNKDYKLAGVINDADDGNKHTANFRLNDKTTYIDTENLKANTWIYFKIVLVVNFKDAFIGVGFSRWTESYDTQYMHNETGEIITTEPPAAERNNYTEMQILTGTTAPSNVEYATAYRSTYLPPDSNFNTDYFYKRNYTTTHTTEVAGIGSLVSTNYEKADDRFPIENLFDGDTTNYLHSKTKISAEAPFNIVCDLGKVVTANSITISGAVHLSRNYHITKFSLYVGNSPDKLKLVGEYTNNAITNTFKFDTTEFQFYKIEASEFSNGYACIRSISFSKNFTGTLLSPDNSMFKYKGNWETCNKYSTFGHVYNGKHASIDFSFYGTEFAIFSNQDTEYGDFEIIIDGKAAKKVKAENNGNNIGVAYISDLLDKKTHNVTIRSKNLFNIDSIAINFAEGSEKHTLSAGGIVAIVLGSLAAVGVITLIALMLAKKQNSLIEPIPVSTTSNSKQKLTKHPKTKQQSKTQNKKQK